MKATIDREGRIALAKEVQAQVGVQPGDEVLLENAATSGSSKPLRRSQDCVMRATSSSIVEPVRARGANWKPNGTNEWSS